ncbi:MAG TPA: DNA gyrase inhibitor YacG [Sorangium sp.]|nr:DNA gyrase inhibitor YacG [Sorangium sp.]
MCRQAITTTSAPPFCSERCRREDLRRWLGGAYRLASTPVNPAIAIAQDPTLDLVTSNHTPEEST